MQKVETKKQDVAIAARLMLENGGIKWNDPDDESRISVSYPTKLCWTRERKMKNRSNQTWNYALATTDGHDMDVSDPEEQEDDCWHF